MNNSPIVFISHSSKDKDRFVKCLAEQLISRGIDAWYDDWELEFGDSLIDIFDKGISKCDVFLSIISKNSIGSNWVKEEFDAGFVKKIAGETKFIPIILAEDNIELPSAVHHIRQCIIDDISNYDIKFEELVKDILGISKKPPLGNPQYFNDEDMIVFKKLGDYCLDEGFDYIFDPYKVSEICEKSDDELAEYIKALEEEGYLKDERENVGGAFTSKSITSNGFYHYFTSYVDGYNEIYKNLINVIYGLNLFSFDEIIEEMNIDKNIVLGLISYFKDEGYVNVYRYEITQITTKGKRYFKKFICD